MKKNIFIFSLVLCVQFLVAQDKFKFGSVPQDLLEMTVYEQDSTASALVVYENNFVYYDYINSVRDFGIVTEYTVRIKILTQEGVDYANGSILFYKGRTVAASESISGLTGATYNLENGKIVSNKLSKEYIFTEDVTEYVKRMKFALPAVKVGSVIEYKYTLRSPNYANPKDFQFQRSIPVKYSHFEITIPEYFAFNRETKGYEPIKVSIEPTNLYFNMNGNQVSCSGEKISAKVFDLPALKDENFVWNYSDFMSSISFELRKINISGVYYKDFSQTWNKIAERLSDNENFGKELKNKGLFKDELSGIMASQGNDEDKLRAILNLVRSEIKWNDRNTLFINSLSKALKDGVGASGEINAVLFNALQNAGYNVLPVVMSLRSRGRIPMTYPSIENLNYFIVQVKTADKVYYMDATRSYCDLNVIPVDCLVDKALCISDKNFAWIDLSKIGNNAERSSLIVSFNEDGVLTGKKVENYLGECAFSFKKRYENAKDEAEFVEKLETNNDIVINNYLIEEKKDPVFGFTESYEFTSNNHSLGDETIITITPLLFETMKTNPFKSEERKLPIEFNYPEDDRMYINIAIPSGYALDEAPASVRFIYGDNKEIEFNYTVQANEVNVQIAYSFKLTTCIIPANDYEGVRDFMSKVYAKCQEMLIFKKL